MSFFDVILLDIIFILFPIICVLIVKSNIDGANSLEKELLVDIANFSSLFLIIKYSDNSAYSVLLANMPFIISILYNRKNATLIIAFVLVFFNILHGFNYIFAFSEYLLYIVLFLLLYKKQFAYNILILAFTFIKGVFLTIFEYYVLGNNSFLDLMRVFICLTIFYIIGVLLINIIDIIAKTVSFNMTLKELEKEKNLKESLFKITHEVKNPIAVCKGYLTMMDYSDMEKVQKYNDIIEEELNRTLDIMNNFSQYTKIEVNLDIMDLSYLLEEVVKNFRYVISSRNIKISYKMNDEIYINGDYSRLKQVFVNLVKNSVEAIGKNGVIDISVRRTRKHVIVVVHDTGHGISSDELSKIDELFYSSKEKGCGIGVSLSKEIIKLHNGTLKYKSVLGEYTDTIIQLPV